jgi:hypothetical protein
MIKHPVKFFAFWLFFEFKEVCTSKLERSKTSSFKPDIDISEVSCHFFD